MYKKNKFFLKKKLTYNISIFYTNIFVWQKKYFIFDINFIQMFLKRPSKKKHTRNKKIKNNVLEKEKFFFLTKNILNIKKKKVLKKKSKLLEIFNQMWFLFWPKEYNYIFKKMKS